VCGCCVRRCGVVAFEVDAEDFVFEAHGGCVLGAFFFDLLCGIVFFLCKYALVLNADEGFVVFEVILQGIGREWFDALLAGELRIERIDGVVLEFEHIFGLRQADGGVFGGDLVVVVDAKVEFILDKVFVEQRFEQVPKHTNLVAAADLRVLIFDGFGGYIEQFVVGEWEADDPADGAPSRHDADHGAHDTVFDRVFGKILIEIGKCFLIDVVEIFFEMFSVFDDV